MPTLPAAGYAYNPVPGVVPSTQMPDAFQRIQGATPDAFGALQGQAFEKLGSTLERNAGEMARQAIARQELYNQTVVDEQQNKWLDYAFKRYYGDPDKPGDTGFFGKHGSAAMEDFPKVRTDLQKMREQFRSELNNPVQQLDFDKATKRTFIHLMESAGSHYDQQSNAHAVNTAKAGIELAGQGVSAASAMLNQDMLNDSVRRGMEHVDKLVDAAEGPGAGQTQRELGYAKIRADAVKKWTKGLAVYDQDKAFEFLEKNKDAVIDDEYTTLVKELSVAKDERIAAAAAHKALYGGHINYGNTGALGDPSKPGWAQQNLTMISSPAGAKFVVHKAAAADIEGFLKDLEATGYKIDPSESAGHANRLLTGSKSQLSEHAYGAAIDINPSRNPYSAAGKKVTDMPANISEIAAKHNLEWGGDWSSPVDTMHFQWRGPGGGGYGGPGTTARVSLPPPDVVDNVNNRNNNFGGIRKAGVYAKAADGGFEKYNSAEDGVRAISDKLDQYAAGGFTTAMNPTGAPLKSLSDIIKVWAPPSDNNDTQALIRRASQLTGFAPDQQLDLNDPVVKAKLVEAIIRNENGGKLPVNPAVISQVAQTQGGPPVRPNRTGLPSLSDTMGKIQNDPALTEAQKFKAFGKAKSEYQALEADLARQEKLEKEQKEQAMKDRYDEIFKDIYSKNPKITPSMIATDPAFNGFETQREHAMNLVNNPPGSGIPQPQSQAMAKELLRRIELPIGNKDKIYDKAEVMQYADRMNLDHLNQLLKKIDDTRGPDGETQLQEVNKFFEKYGKFIDRSNPLTQQIDTLGGARLLEYRNWVEQRIQQYKEEHKDWRKLFVELDNPDFIGHPAVIAHFQPSMAETAASIAAFGQTGIMPLPPAGPPPTGLQPLVPAKKAGETLDQWRKRTGR